MHEIIILGHRGLGPTNNLEALGPSDTSIPPENTIAAFQRALDFGADGIELDVIQVDADPEIYVAHTLSPNAVATERPPTLEAVLDWAVLANMRRQLRHRDPIVINIDIRGNTSLALKTATTILQHQAIGTALPEHRFIITCRSIATLARLRDKHPELQLAPAFATDFLFGSREPEGGPPAWARYRCAALADIRDHVERHCLNAVSCCFWDMYRPLVNLCAQLSVALHLTPSDYRTVTPADAARLVEAANFVPVVFKTDEPYLARSQIHAVFGQHYRYPEILPTTPTVRTSLGRPITPRPKAFSSLCTSGL